MRALIAARSGRLKILVLVLVDGHTPVVKSLAAMSAVTLMASGCAHPSDAHARTDLCDFRNVKEEDR